MVTFNIKLSLMPKSDETINIDSNKLAESIFEKLTHGEERKLTKDQFIDGYCA